MLRRPISYQLLIRISRPTTVTIGRLGRFRFPAGDYVYTGSAKRNLEARIHRHLSKTKRLRWHIDYLLADHDARIVGVRRSVPEECLLNRRTRGEVVVPGFGSSDCRAGCGGHLKKR
jgi:Uri superfamily endonuclease